MCVQWMQGCLRWIHQWMQFIVLIGYRRKTMTTSVDAGKALNTTLICYLKKQKQKTSASIGLERAFLTDNGYLANNFF